MRKGVFIKRDSDFSQQGKGVGEYYSKACPEENPRGKRDKGILIRSP